MRTIEWDDGAVRLVDQTLLPQEYVILRYDDHLGIGEAIRDMKIRGAPAIGAAAAFGMALAAQNSRAATSEALLRDLEDAAGLLSKTRPTAVNLSWAIRRMMAVAVAHVQSGPLDVRKTLILEAQQIADEDVAINRQMGRHGATLIENGASILTHCNAGALATVDYGTALGVIRAATEEGKKVHVYVDETRPFLQGARLTAWELARDGIPMTLITDNMAGHFISRGKVDIVVVGADRVAANGDVANKIGTYVLAVLARENGIPFYVVAPTSTVDLEILSGADIPIEERDPAEVTHIRGMPIAPEGVRASHPAFDVTPHRYVSGIVTEKGVVCPPYDRNLRKIKDC